MQCARIRPEHEQPGRASGQRGTRLNRPPERKRAHSRMVSRGTSSAWPNAIQLLSSDRPRSPPTAISAPFGSSQAWLAGPLTPS
jgi:hypothetical protein